MGALHQPDPVMDRSCPRHYNLIRQLLYPNLLNNNRIQMFHSLLLCYTKFTPPPLCL